MTTAHSYKYKISHKNTSLSLISQSWKDFDTIIKSIIVDNNISKILEIGGGRNPYLDSSFIEDHNIDYTIFEIDEQELLLAKKLYPSFIVDLSSDEADISKYKGTFDLVFSHMVMEHVNTPDQFHKNCVSITADKGFVVHFFATKYSIHTLLNQVLPDFISDWLVFTFQTRKKEFHAKFKAYYKWCFGPTKKNIARLEKVGYRLIQYNGYVGHNYLNRYKFLHFFEKIWSKFLLKVNSPLMCSNAFFVAQKSKDS